MHVCLYITVKLSESKETGAETAYEITLLQGSETHNGKSPNTERP